MALRHSYSPETCMRQRTAHKGNVLQPGETNIGHVLSAATHQPIVFLPRQPRADALSGPRSSSGGKIALVAHSTFSSNELTPASLRRNRLRQD
jgi:hypothetical protein